MLNRAVMILAVFLTTTGCNKQVNPKSQDSLPDDESFVSIGTVGGVDIQTQEIVETVLATEQIECYFDGSVLYDLHVKKKDASSAIKLIEKSKELEGRNIFLHPEGNGGEEQENGSGKTPA